MSKKKLGYLDQRDPLYHILSSRIFSHIVNPTFTVEQLSSRQVYRYTEQKSDVSVIGKFFDPHDNHIERLNRLKNEYDNIIKIRSFGFDRHPFYVIRAITKEHSIGLAIVEEYVKGRDLDHYFKKAVFQNAETLLYEKLSLLASFLRELHNRTKTQNRTNNNDAVNYILSLIQYLSRHSVIETDHIREYEHIVKKWDDYGLLKDTNEVIIHGDATPTNFIFTDSGDVVAIDMERMKLADPAYDVGMVCGELKHGFLWRTNSLQGSEPFIRHFLKEYVRTSHNPHDDFNALTKRIPFYMALTELRVSRNKYLDWNYRKKIAQEALNCLKGGLDNGKGSAF